jgi:hypothetical protein
MKYGTPEFITLLIDMIQRDKRHDLYKETCECYNKMAVHIYGKKPDAILDRTRPSEPEEVKNYRKENYEPTTKSTAGQALSILSKIFNPRVYQIKWKDQTANGKELQDYTLEYYPVFNSIVKFMAESGLKRMIADPNGLMCVRPLVAPASVMERAKPIVVMYGSPSIWWKDIDCYVIHRKEEEVERGGIVHHFTYIDKNNIIDFQAQIMNAKEIAITETFVYPTLGEMPCWELQGEPETTNEGIPYFVSYFDPAVPHWNLAITHDSDLFGSYIRHLFPQKVELAEDCDYIYENQRCTQGNISMPEGKSIKCPGCGGTGYRRSSGPYGIYQVSKSKLDGPQSTSFAPVQYITVPVEPTKMLEERVDRLHEKGLAALNMDIVSKIGENQSGVAKVIDRGELYDFLAKVSDVVYDTHLTNIYYFFNKFMFGIEDANPNRKLDENLPEINKPASFDISSTGEMTLEYKAAKEADVNPEYLRQKQIALISKEFSNNPDLMRRLILTCELDPLPGITPEEADTMVMSGIISKTDAVLHFQIGKIITQAILEDEGFYNLEPLEKIAKIREYAEKFVKENTPQLDTSAIDTEGSSDQA